MTRRRNRKNKYADDTERLARSIIKSPGGCWIWTGCRTASGYGRLLGSDKKTHWAHRLSYTTFVGPIPDGLHIDHLCRVRHCVNPRHLQPVPARINVARSPYAVSTKNAAKTRCKWGHPFDEANTGVRPDGRRVCRTCRREGLAAMRAADPERFRAYARAHRARALATP